MREASVARDDLADLSLTGHEARREEVFSLTARAEGREAARERFEPHELGALRAADRAALVRLHASQNAVPEEEREDDDDANIECLSHDFVS
ncbi:hypothetical protein PSP6_610021 [Paraburkholderia tropica]|nr:hypothetical protein PSP6_610021 [Paraburkholderia tropica]